MKQQNQKQQILKNQQKNKKLNNKGMTLVEVIIAMTLLTVVIVPVLQAVTSSMYYNAKARNRQNVTLEAETIMETFKGYDLESLQAMFDSVSGTADVPGIEAASFECPADMDADELIFKVNDMKTENGKLYDAEIKATKTIKAEEVMEHGNADGEKDAIFKGNIEYDVNAWDAAKDDFITNHLSVTGGFLEQITFIDIRTGTSDQLTEADIDLSKIVLHEKETVYTIRQDGGSNKVEAKMVYRYYVKDHPYYGPDLDGDGEIEDEDEKFSFSYPAIDSDGDGNYDTVTSYIEVDIPLDPDDETFYNLTTAANLERVFAFYYPSYEETEEDEIIKIDNQTGLPIEFYLLKQKLPGKTNLFIHSKEVGYTPDVSCVGGAVTLLHNLKDDISDGSEIGLPAGVSTGTFSAVVDYTDDKTSDGAKAKIVRKNKVLVYNLELRVFDDNTANVVTELKGTMIEKDKEYN